MKRHMRRFDSNGVTALMCGRFISTDKDKEKYGEIVDYGKTKDTTCKACVAIYEKRIVQVIGEWESKTSS